MLCLPSIFIKHAGNGGVEGLGGGTDGGGDGENMFVSKPSPLTPPPLLLLPSLPPLRDPRGVLAGVRVGLIERVKEEIKVIMYIC